MSASRAALSSVEGQPLVNEQSVARHGGTVSAWVMITNTAESFPPESFR